MPSRYGAQEAAETAYVDQPLSEELKSLVREANERLFIFEQGCRDMHARAKECRQIALINDPEQDLHRTHKRKILQLNTLSSTLNNCVADQMDNMPGAIMLPERAGLEKVAEDLTDVVRFILQRNDFESLHRRRAEDFFTVGTSVLQVFWDEDMDGGKGNVGLLRWPIEAMLWDPACEDIQDSRAVIKVSWHPLSWYAAHYPEAAPYVSARQYATQDVGVPDAWRDKLPGDEDRSMMMEYWYRRYDAKKRRYTVNVAYIAGDALLDHAEDIYKHGMYPFILDVYAAIEGMPVGNGLVWEYKDIQRYVNRYYDYLDTNAAMAAKTRMLVARQARIDNDALTDFSKNLITGDQIDENAVRFFETKPLSGAIGNIAIQLQTDMKQDSGQNQFTRGETAGGVTAASAIAALQEAGGKITRYRTNILNQGFKRMVEQIMWLVSQFYTEEQARLITGTDGDLRQVELTPDRLYEGDGLDMDAMQQPDGKMDLNALRKALNGVGPAPKRKAKHGKGVLPPPPYNVEVQTNRRNPMRVQAQNDLFINAFTMAAQSGQPFPLTALFELLNVDGKERILPVLRESETLHERMQAMEQQMQQLAQATEQMDKENKNLRQMLGAQNGAASGDDGGSTTGGMFLENSPGAPGATAPEGVQGAMA